jgi:hypothetical protein
VEGRGGKEIEVADVIVMEMGDDDILYGFRFRPEKPQARGWTANVITAALRRNRRRKAGVDDHLAAAAADQPDEIVERHRAVVRITADEVLRPAPRVMRILDRVDLVRQFTHARVTRANFRLPTWTT